MALSAFLQNGVDILAMIGIDGDTDAAGDDQCASLKNNGVPRKLSIIFRATLSAVWTSFWSGSTRTNSSPPKRATVSSFRRIPVNFSATNLQQQISDMVAEGIIDLFELVYVEHHERQLFPISIG